ncbi:hypothetical protein RI367_001216 [Sorochytrium milnesiophthora]
MPAEILLQIMAYLSTGDLARLALSSRRLHQLFADTLLWRVRLQTDFRSSSVWMQQHLRQHTSPRDHYRKLHAMRMRYSLTNPSRTQLTFREYNRGLESLVHGEYKRALHTAHHIPLIPFKVIGALQLPLLLLLAGRLALSGESTSFLLWYARELLQVSKQVSTPEEAQWLCILIPFCGLLPRVKMLSSPMRDMKVKRHRITEQKRRERIREAHVQLRHLMQLDEPTTSLHILEAAIRTLRHYMRLVRIAEEACRSAMQLDAAHDIIEAVNNLLAQLQQQFHPSSPSSAKRRSEQSPGAAGSGKGVRKQARKRAATRGVSVSSASPSKLDDPLETPKKQTDGDQADSTLEPVPLCFPTTPEAQLTGPTMESQCPPEKVSRPPQVFQQTLTSQRKRMRSKLLSPSAHLKPFKSFNPHQKGMSWKLGSGAAGSASKQPRKTESAKKEQVYQTFAQRLASLAKTTLSPPEKSSYREVKSSDAVFNHHTSHTRTTAPTAPFTSQQPLQERRPVLRSPSKTLSSSSILGLKYGANYSSLSSSLLLKGNAVGPSAQRAQSQQRTQQQPVAKQANLPDNPFQSFSDSAFTYLQRQQQASHRPLLLQNTTSKPQRPRPSLISARPLARCDSYASASSSLSPDPPALDIPLHMLYPNSGPAAMAPAAEAEAERDLLSKPRGFLDLAAAHIKSTTGRDTDPYAGVLDLPFDSDLAGPHAFIGVTSAAVTNSTLANSLSMFPYVKREASNPVVSAPEGDFSALASLVDLNAFPSNTSFEQTLALMDPSASDAATGTMMATSDYHLPSLSVMDENMVDSDAISRMFEDLPPVVPSDVEALLQDARRRSSVTDFTGCSASFDMTGASSSAVADTLSDSPDDYFNF